MAQLLFKIQATLALNFRKCLATPALNRKLGLLVKMCVKISFYIFSVSMSPNLSKRKYRSKFVLAFITSIHLSEWTKSSQDG